MKKLHIIKKNFSKHAKHYDRYASIQKNCAYRLIGKTEGGDFKCILDLGCGTGIYTKFLRERFRKARIKAVDISEEMICLAKKKLPGKKIEFVTGNAESMNFEEKFDLITSNSTFQWFSNLERAFLKYKKTLKDKGVILFSTFGPATFAELNGSLEILFGKKLSITSQAFIRKEKIEKLLKKNFRNVSVEEEIYREEYGLFPELLAKIKYSGIRGYGMEKKGVWTPGILRKLGEIYKDEFCRSGAGEIRATYQVFFARGEK